MRNRAVADLLLIMALYVAYWTLIYLATADPSNNILTVFGISPTADGDPDQFREAFKAWATGLMIVSLLVVLVWYVLGEWGPRAHRRSDTWWVIAWLVLFAVALGAGLVAAFGGPQASENEFGLAALFCAGGVFFFWLATVFFSPVAIKHLVFPAKYVRFW
jgi:hypothetical protein